VFRRPSTGDDRGQLVVDQLNQINRVWTALARRAERVPDEERLHSAFVEADCFSAACGRESGVIFGRRGAGKTHTLLEMARRVREDGGIAVFVDMRALGSNAGIYDNPQTPFASRASRLLVDLVEAIHEHLFQMAVAEGPDGLSDNLHRLGPALDLLGEAATQIRVTGTLTVNHGANAKVASTTSRKAAARLARRGLQVDAELDSGTQRDAGVSVEVSRQGTEEFYLHMGQMERAVRHVYRALGGRELWLLLDEWSEGVPLELQPVLADLLRRSFLRSAGVTVKTMAIEHRSQFRKRTASGGYVGLELGADTAETVVLDASLTIGEDSGRACEFLRSMLGEHFLQVARELGQVPADLTGAQVIAASFQPNAFETLVLASEGNPRDAMNLVSKAARSARGNPVSERDVLLAARDYFWNTKHKNIEGERATENLFRRLITHSLERRRRTFLVDRLDEQRGLYNRLYDQRLIHLIRSGIRITAGSGVYDGYAVDFGSYADRVLAGTLRWTNDGWANPRSFFVNDLDPHWREGVVGRRISLGI
jgi:hypothetical protein